MEVGLENGTVLGIDGRRQSYLLRCLEGTLWITKSGDDRDYLLTAGEQMELGRKNRVVVEAWGASRILILNAGHAGKEPALAGAWHLVSAS